MLPVPIRRPYEFERLPQTRMAALLSLILRAGDLLVLAAAAIAAYKLRFGPGVMSIEFERAIVRGLLFTLLILGPSSTYRGWQAKDVGRHVLRFLALWGVVFLLGVLYVAFLKVPGITSRLWWGYWFIGTVAASGCVRLLCRIANGWSHAHGHEACRAVVVGSPETVSRIACELASSAADKISLLGWFAIDQRADDRVGDVARLGEIDSLCSYVESNDIRQVWISPGETDARWVNQVLNALQHTTADIKYVPSLANQQLLNGSAEFLNGLPVINLRSSPLDGEARMIKGIEDRVLALLILILVIPLMAMWGLAFKPNTDDMREASSRRLLQQLWDAGAKVRAYDPEATEEAHRIFGERDDLVLCDSARAALADADALVVVTEWKQFRSPDFARLKQSVGDAVIFDGRNLYHPGEVESAGLAYYGIGRGRSVTELPSLPGADGPRTSW